MTQSVSASKISPAGNGIIFELSKMGLRGGSASKLMSDRRLRLFSARISFRRSFLRSKANKNDVIDLYRKFQSFFLQKGFLKNDPGQLRSMTKL